MFKAVENVMNDTNIGFCFFHYSKNIYKNMQKFGIALYYKNNFVFRTFCRLIFYLPFEKHDKIVMKFEMIKNLFITRFNDKNTVDFLNILKKYM